MMKEEQIEEIAKWLDELWVNYESTPREVAESIINAGYRKADEVRKETAREILDKILKVIEFEASLDDKNVTFNLCLEIVKDVIYEYFEAEDESTD